jgi:hypothetical protein
MLLKGINIKTVPFAPYRNGSKHYIKNTNFHILLQGNMKTVAYDNLREQFFIVKKLNVAIELKCCSELRSGFLVREFLLFDRLCYAWIFHVHEFKTKQ